MRTTIDIDADVLEAARAIARVEQRGLGRVVSELARRGLAPARSGLDDEDGFPVFRVPPDVPAITDEMVQVALEEA